MIGDKSLYPKIGQTIFTSSPDDAVTIVMRATLSEEGNVGTFEFDYIKRDGSVNWFDAGAKATTELTKLLGALRDSYIKDGQPAWINCVFTLDVENEKFEFNIGYDNK
jgi:hypothetical protein